jgi:hypothetical protein
VTVGIQRVGEITGAAAYRRFDPPPTQSPRDVAQESTPSRAVIKLPTSLLGALVARMGGALESYPKGSFVNLRI